MNKFSEMMAKLGEENPAFGHVIACDEAFDLFNRAWCIGEVVQGRRDGLHQILKVPSVEAVRRNRRKLESLDVRNCQASRAEDKECILASIENVDAFNRELRALLLQPEIGLLDEWSTSVRQAVDKITTTSSAYLFQWPRFTGEYRSRMAPPTEGAGSDTHPLLQCMWLLGLFCVPLLVTLALLSLPFSRPDAGLDANWLHVSVAFPSFSLLCYLFVPQWTQVATKVSLPMRCTVLWPVVAAALTSVPIPILSAVLDVYPVPFAPLTASVTYVAMLPLLWLLIPANLRRSEAFKTRFLWAVVSQITLTTLFCLCYPMLNAWVQATEDDRWQLAGLVTLFLTVRIVFEKICEAISKRLHPDVLPATVFIAELAYQCALSIFFSHLRSWLVVVTLVCYNILENAYYLVCFLRSQKKEGVSCDEDDDSMTRPSSEPVAAVLLLRQLVALMTPAQFLVLFVVLSSGPAASYSSWVDQMSRRRLGRTVLFLCASLAFELLVAGITVAKLRTHGLRPLRFLYGIVCAGGYCYYLSAATTTMVWYAALQLVHSGCDYSLHFAWANGASTWVHGFEWE